VLLPSFPPRRQRVGSKKGGKAYTTTRGVKGSRRRCAFVGARLAEGAATRCAQPRRGRAWACGGGGAARARRGMHTFRRAGRGAARRAKWTARGASPERARAAGSPKGACGVDRGEGGARGASALARAERGFFLLAARCGARRIRRGRVAAGARGGVASFRGSSAAPPQRAPAAPLEKDTTGGKPGRAGGAGRRVWGRLRPRGSGYAAGAAGAAQRAAHAW
jgi:hypothetical protein